MPHLAKRTVANVIVAGPKTWIYCFAQVSPRVTIESRAELADAADLIDADDRLTQR